MLVDRIVLVALEYALGLVPKPAPVSLLFLKLRHSPLVMSGYYPDKRLC